jgi:glutathione S-transferase
MATIPAPIVLFHYPLSPWGAKVAAYLVLRGIQYTECHQPLQWPRPDLTDHFNIQYRRIPVLAIGRDFYYDTSLIFEKLEALFPETKYLMPEVPAEQALTKLLDYSDENSATCVTT